METKVICIEEMSKRDKKEYKRLKSIEKFLAKKIRKMQKVVNLYYDTQMLKNVHIHRAMKQIENKYR